MTSLQRRLLRLLPRLGVRVVDVEPGVVLLIRDQGSRTAAEQSLRRRRNVRVVAVGPDSLVTRRPGLRVEALDADGHLVTTARVRVTRPIAGANLVKQDPTVGVRRLGDKLALVHHGAPAVDAFEPDVFLVAPQNTVRTADLGSGLHLTAPVDLFTGRKRARRHQLVSQWLLQEHLSDVLWRYRVDCVLDVGANRGQYARFLRQAGYRGRIISLEPVPEVFAQLAAAAADDDLWDVHQLALGRESGELEMHVASDGTLSSALPPSEFGTERFAALREIQVQRVPVRRLDALLPELFPAGETPRILLKLDTQGFDLEAFAGLGDAVDRVVALQSEVALLTIYEHMPRMPEALAVYEAAGFEVSGMYPVTREKRTARVLEYDCVMVRAAAR